MKKWVVYKHVSPSGKVYIGISSNVKNRWARNGYYYHLSDTAFSRALDKYGWDNFEHFIIAEDLSKKEACNMEIQLIAHYKSLGICYNITNGGEGCSGKQSKTQIENRINSRIRNNSVEYLVIDKAFNYIVCSTEKEAAEYLSGKPSNISHVLMQPIGYTFKKHYIWKHPKGASVNIDAIKEQVLKAIAVRKKKQSEFSKTNFKKAIAARIESVNKMTVEERKKKYGHGKCKGRKHSEETKRKMSAAAKGRDMSAAIAASRAHPHISVSRCPIAQYDLNGNFIKNYPCIKHASLETGILASSISNCLGKRSHTAGGYKWQYFN